jgi:hypothetical protein
MTLQQIYDKHRKGDWPDKGTTHTYIEYYEELLAPYRHTAKEILELGLMSGESLKMFSEYFDGEVYGMDCDIKPIGGVADLTDAIARGYNIAIGDATNPRDIAKFFAGKKFDVVVEDCNHDLNQQLQIYAALKPYLNKGSIYIIEDVQHIDKDRKTFEDIDPSRQVQIIDRRHLKNRYDDCLIVITDKE